MLPGTIQNRSLFKVPPDTERVSTERTHVANYMRETKIPEPAYTRSYARDYPSVNFDLTTVSPSFNSDYNHNNAIDMVNVFKPSGNKSYKKPISKNTLF